MHSEKLYHLNLTPGRFPLFLLFILIENILQSKMNKYKSSDIGLTLHSFNISNTF